MTAAFKRTLPLTFYFTDKATGKRYKTAPGLEGLCFDSALKGCDLFSMQGCTILTGKACSRNPVIFLEAPRDL